MEVYECRQDGSKGEDLAAKTSNRTTCLVVMNAFFKQTKVLVENGIAYDGSHTLFSSFPIRPGDDAPDATKSPKIQELTENEVDVDETTVTVSTVDIPYKVRFVLTSHIYMPPRGDIESWRAAPQHVLRAIDMSLTAFAKWQAAGCDSPDWFIDGVKAYRSNSEEISLGGAFVAMKGYLSTLRCNLAGLTLVTDLSVSVSRHLCNIFNSSNDTNQVFLAGGDLISVIAKISRQSTNDFIQSVQQRGFRDELLDSLTRDLKGLKIMLTHLNHHRKIKGFGPAANSPKTQFEFEGKMITVADYFSICSRDNSKPLYKKVIIIDHIFRLDSDEFTMVFRHFHKPNSTILSSLL